MGLLRYLGVRLVQAVITLLLSSLVVFLGVRALPGDPALALAGEEADPATLAAVRSDLGLDQPVLVQYLKFLGNLVRGDLGSSIRTGQPVTDLLAATLPVTLWLALLAVLVALVVGLGAGVVAAVFRGRWPEWVANGLALAGLSVPSFWLGILAILYLAVGLQWFPASGYVPLTEDPVRGVYYLVLPAVVLGTALAAVVMRQTRASMIETLSTDYVRTARAKGLPQGRAVIKHALRTSLIPTGTYFAFSLAGLFTGATFTEILFNFPGLGAFGITTIQGQDVHGTVAVAAFAGLCTLAGATLADIMVAILDPRVRVS